MTKKLSWTKEEDERLADILRQNYFSSKLDDSARMQHSWGDVADLMPARSAKQCRERWCYNLNPLIRKDAWSIEEDATLIYAQLEVGNHWAQIARLLPGRTENSVKTRFKSIMRAKRRAWRQEEDEIIIAMHRGIGSRWDKIADKLPGRTPNGVKTRYSALRKGIKYKTPEPGAPNQVLRSGKIMTELRLRQIAMAQVAKCNLPSLKRRQRSVLEHCRLAQIRKRRKHDDGGEFKDEEETVEVVVKEVLDDCVNSIAGYTREDTTMPSAVAVTTKKEFKPTMMVLSPSAGAVEVLDDQQTTDVHQTIFEAFVQQVKASSTHKKQASGGPRMGCLGFPIIRPGKSPLAPKPPMPPFPTNEKSTAFVQDAKNLQDVKSSKFVRDIKHQHKGFLQQRTMEQEKKIAEQESQLAALLLQQKILQQRQEHQERRHEQEQHQLEQQRQRQQQERRHEQEQHQLEQQRQQQQYQQRPPQLGEYPGVVGSPHHPNAHNVRATLKAALSNPTMFLEALKGGNLPLAGAVDKNELLRGLAHAGVDSNMLLQGLAREGGVNQHRRQAQMGKGAVMGGGAPQGRGMGSPQNAFAAMQHTTNQLNHHRDHVPGHFQANNRNAHGIASGMANHYMMNGGGMTSGNGMMNSNSGNRMMNNNSGNGVNQLVGTRGNTPVATNMASLKHQAISQLLQQHHSDQPTISPNGGMDKKQAFFGVRQENDLDHLRQALALQQHEQQLASLLAQQQRHSNMLQPRHRSTVAQQQQQQQQHPNLAHTANTNDRSILKQFMQRQQSPAFQDGLMLKRQQQLYMLKKQLGM